MLSQIRFDSLDDWEWGDFGSHYWGYSPASENPTAFSGILTSSFIFMLLCYVIYFLLWVQFFLQTNSSLIFIPCQTNHIYWLDFQTSLLWLNLSLCLFFISQFFHFQQNSQTKMNIKTKSETFQGIVKVMWLVWQNTFCHHLHWLAFSYDSVSGVFMI